jgi:putative endonuclease
MLRCNDNSLYTGVTTDVQRRLHEHNNTEAGSKYVKYRRPATLVYLEEGHDRSSALKREHEIKGLTKKQKEDLVKDYQRLSP